MASTSGLTKDTDASQSIPASTPSSSATYYSLVSLFSSCFAWFSRFFSTHLDQSSSGAPTSTTVSQPENEDTNALQGMLSNNSNPAMKNLLYDVYINHYGPDVKDSLATTLFTILNDKGLRVYLDSEELEFGDSLPKEIEEAMRSASLHFAIFSQNYARSPRCLAELSFMFKTGIQIVPIFYHILPEYIRHVKENFAVAFSRHEKESKYRPEKLEEWKKALNSVSFNIGHIVNSKEDEVELRKKIALSVSKVIKKLPLEVAEHPTGLEEAMKDFEMKIQSAEHQHPVHIVGLWGMGGSGKTTLAKHFYNIKHKTMEKSSFLLNVRDSANKSELHTKQKELLEDLGLKDVRVDGIEAGKGRIASRLRSVRVLIVVDDVDDVEQLDALLPTKDSLQLPDKDSLGRGSLIIVTTRELEVLKSWGISTVYKMKTLDPYHAQQLFCWHAFLQPSPVQGFQSLVKDFLNVCGGLPLSLTVFGTQLIGNSSRDFWKQQLEISTTLPSNIKESLKLSYDALDDEEKEIFLDVACFFIGEEKSMVLNVWDGSRWNGLHSWERLFSKCLVELDHDGECIRMHNNLRDLGREIANQQSPYRIWFPYQSIEVYNQAQSIRIRGIAYTTPGSRIGFEELPQFWQGGKVIVNTNTESRLLTPSSLGLKIFEVKGRFYNNVSGDLSKELLWLRCIDVGQRNLCSFGPLEYLRVLELHERGDSQLEELWKSESHAPILLRGLIISGCHKFQRFPNSIGRLSHLKKVVVSNASTLKDLPTEFSLLRSLEHLEVICCAELSSLPSNFGNLRYLRHLSLKGCEKLRSLPDSFKELMFLQRLNLNECKNLALGSNILKKMTQLEYVNLSGCIQLEVLPCDITNQEWLKEVDVGGCRMLRELPVNIGQLSKLQVMKIGSELLTRLPNSLGDLSSLTDLRIETCPQLESLPDSLGRLNLLEHFSIAFSGLKSLPKSIRKLNNLQTLAIDKCPASQLNLGSGWSSLSLRNLKWMSLTAIEVSNISISPECCPVLETLRIRDIDNLKRIEVLPSTVKDLDLVRCKSLRNIRGIVGLVNIERLKIEKCPKLDALHSLARSVSLKKFVLIDCYGVQKIEGLKRCKALEELRAETRWEKEGIDSLETLERLRTVKLRANRRSGVEGCIQSIQKWPREIIVCTRAVRDAASLVSSFDFPALSLFDSFAHQKISLKPKLVQKPLLIIDAVMVCFVINCTSPRMQFRISSINDEVFSTEVEEGRWFVTGVFTESCRYDAAEEYRVERDSGEGEVEKGLLVIGEEQSLVEAFRSLWVVIAAN